MGTIKVHAGDFLQSDGSCHGDTLWLKTAEHSFLGEQIPLTKLQSVELASEENVKKLGGTVGWGVVGGVLLGPVGLLAGLLVGGRGKQVTFVAKFKDGRKLLATTDSKTYTTLLASVF